MTTSLNKESKTRHSPLLNHQTVHDVVVNQQQSLPFNQDNLLDASINHNHDIPLIKSTSFRDFLSSPVDIKHVDLILLSHSLSTGIVDAATFSNWSVFVGMQTGNTVILGLSTAHPSQNPHAWLTTLVSISSYLLGAFLTFRITNHLLRRPHHDVPNPLASHRSYLFINLLIQALLILIPAIILLRGIVPSNSSSPPLAIESSDILSQTKIVALIPLLALGTGMQIATSRLLGFNELPVNVITSTYCDLMGDERLFDRKDNRKRDRRLGGVLGVLGGGIASAWLMKAGGTHGMAVALFVAAGIKVLAALGVMALKKG